MIVVANFLAVMVSSTLLLLLPENKDRNFGEMMRFAFTLMVNPSGRYQYSDYPISLIITTVVVLIGMISLTGGTVCYITSVINSIIRKSATSKHKLKMENHIVILNYNHRVPTLLYDYSFDDMNSTYIVILSDHPKEEVEKSINNVYSSNNLKNKFRNIIIRTGNPMSKYDLDNISLETAKTVIIMTPEEEMSDSSGYFSVSKLFMFVNWYLSTNDNKTRTNLIVESDCKEVEEMIRNYKRGNQSSCVIPVNGNEILGKIMAMIVINPLLKDVIGHLISFAGVEMYVEDVADGSTLSDEMSKLKTVMPILDIKEPSNGALKRVYIAEDETEIANYRSDKFVLNKPLPEKTLMPDMTFDNPEIVIIGVNDKLPYVLQSLSCFKEEYKEVNIHVTLMDTTGHEEELHKYCSDPAYADIIAPEPIIIKNIYKPFDDIDDSLLEKMNSALLLSDDHDRSDHIELLFWNNLEKVKPGECIIEILDMQNKDICNNKQTIISDFFISCMLAQLGKQPVRLDVIKDLLTFENDQTSMDSNNRLVNRCNLFSIKVSHFFSGLNEIPEFSSKREMIVWVYEATDHNYMPIGCIKDGVNYLFARAEGSDTDLDTSILLSEDGSAVLNAERLSFSADDEIIALQLNPEE